MASVRSEMFFAKVRGGRRLCVTHRPNAASEHRGAVVHVHAFAEEMNKSRRVVSQAARALAAEGWSVLLVDLAGCGDSSNEFADATWSDWIEDTLFATEWARANLGSPVWLWGLRAGCLIAGEAAARIIQPTPLLLWQPVWSGQLHLTQFLRLRLVNEALGQADARTGTGILRTRLAAGENLDVSGYSINPLLATGLDSAELQLDGGHAAVILREVSSAANATLSPVTEKHVARAATSGFSIDAAAIAGPPFWNTFDVVECPAIVEATVTALGGRNA